MERLEAALKVLGEDDPDAEPLKVALKRAKVQAQVRPVGERLDLCLQYVTRVKKQVARAEEQVREAKEVQAQMEGGLRDLEALRAEASDHPRQCPEPSTQGQATDVDPREELIKLRAQVAEFAVRAPCKSGGRVQSIKEGKDVGLNRIGASPRWRRRGQPFCGHVQFDRGSRFCIEGRWARCSLMHYLSWSSWRGAQYGLRGVRVGEASHPRPPRSDLRRLRTSRQGQRPMRMWNPQSPTDTEDCPCVSLTTAASAIETVALVLGQ